MPARTARPGVRAAASSWSAVEHDLAGRAGQRTGQQVGQLVVAATGKADEADDLTACGRERQPAGVLAGQTAHGQRRLGAAGLVGVRVHLLRGAAEHELDQVALGLVVHRHVGHLPPVAQDDRAVAVLDDLVEPVRHEQHADALRAQLADDAEQPLDALARQVRGRLVQDEQVRGRTVRSSSGRTVLEPGLREPARDGDQSPLGHRQVTHAGVRRHVEADLLERRPHPLPLLPPPDAACEAGREPGDAQVLQDGHRRDQREVLVDERHARAAGTGTQVGGDVLPSHAHVRPGLGRVVAGQDLDQSRLATAVLPDEADDLTARELQGDVLQHRHSAEALRERPGDQRRSRGGPRLRPGGQDAPHSAGNSVE